MHAAQLDVADAQTPCELGVLGGAGGQTFGDCQALLVQAERCLAVAQCPLHVAQLVVADAQIACELGVLGGAGGQTFSDLQALLVQPERCLAVAQFPLHVAQMVVAEAQIACELGVRRFCSSKPFSKPHLQRPCCSRLLEPQFWRQTVGESIQDLTRIAVRWSQDLF